MNMRTSSRTSVLDRLGVTDIVFIGDIIDAYWYGHKYLKDYNIIGPKEDHELSKLFLKQFYERFPYATLIVGNHDMRIVRREDDGFVEDFETVFKSKFNPPKTWNIVGQKIIKEVCYVHGTGVSGQNGSVTMFRTKRMSKLLVIHIPSVGLYILIMVLKMDLHLM